MIIVISHVVTIISRLRVTLVLMVMAIIRINFVALTQIVLLRLNILNLVDAKCQKRKNRVFGKNLSNG